MQEKHTNNNFRFCMLMASPNGRQFVVELDKGMRVDKTF